MIAGKKTGALSCRSLSQNDMNDANDMLFMSHPKGDEENALGG